MHPSPDHQHQDRLLDGVPSIEGPLYGDDEEIAVLDPVDRVGETGADDVQRGERYDQRAEEVAQHLQGLHHQLLALENRVEGQGQVNR